MSAPNESAGRMAIVDVELKLGEHRLATKLSVPAEPMHLVQILPIVQRIADVVVDAGVADAEAQGRTISCTKGCGACCRQLVPISQVEARNVRDLVESMPEPRRSHVRARFAEARERLLQAGLWQKLLDRDSWDESTFVSIGLDYFHQGVPCPFLEEESCSIHLDRPVTCREYLVTSPAANCACPTKDNIEKVETPVQVWTALARFDKSEPGSKYCRWVPLVMAPEWADTEPDLSERRPGPDLLRELFEHLTGQSAPGAPARMPDTLPSDRTADASATGPSRSDLP